MEKDGEVNTSFINGLSEYLPKILRQYKKQENIQAKKEKRAEEERIKAEEEKKRAEEERIRAEEKERRAKEERIKAEKIENQKKVAKTFGEIESFVAAMSSNNSDIYERDIWKAVKKVLRDRDESTNRNLDEEAGEVEKEVLSMIDKRILEENDKLYYEQVKYFTNNFKFLRDYSEIQAALTGARSRKFTDKESFNRFCNLRELLQKPVSESAQIEELLADDTISDIDKRILTERRAVISKEEMAR